MKSIAALLFLLFSFCGSYACNCVEPRKGLKECNVVFEGEVLSVYQTGADISRYFEIMLRVDTVIKGDITNTVCLVMGACPVPMKVGERFMVYALYGHDRDLGKQLYTGKCTKTHKLP